MKKPIPTEARTPAAPVGPKQTTLRQTFIMTNRNGLHARPSAQLVKTLNQFHCEVIVKHDSASANGRSIMGLMCLAVGCESKMTLVMTGDDAPQAIAAVQRLFDTQFEEAYAPPNKSAIG